MPDYPDISDILARKEEGRRELAKLDFWEKVRRMEALRERVRPLKEAREAARAARGATRPLAAKERCSCMRRGEGPVVGPSPTGFAGSRNC